ncbi:Dps family protein [Bacillus massiliigorillae]|uniref:Dps family protein n=1 Tax=Bacillus massiliigorillae TaxID=1243664 RepID=UPI00039ACEDE|nr:DNA starvation/stationary phase protection protein [Bacillus massiliigorillae]
MSNQLHSLMNTQLTNWTVLYTKLHNFHWYVKGPHFFTLHEKFEEFYTETATYVDDIAERLLTIGGQPVGTLKETLKMATIQEANGSEKADEMVQIILDDFKIIAKDIETLLEAAEEAQDEETGDLFLGIKATLEKNMWMLQAYLG